MAWVSPTGHNELDNWTNPHRCYDDNLNLYGYSSKVQGSACEFLHTAISCDKVRVYFYLERNCSIEVYYGDAYHEIFNGAIPSNEWVEKLIGSTESVTKIKMVNQGGPTQRVYVKELDFNEAEAPPPSYIPQLIMIT